MTSQRWREGLITWTVRSFWPDTVRPDMAIPEATQLDYVRQGIEFWSTVCGLEFEYVSGPNADIEIVWEIMTLDNPPYPAAYGGPDKSAPDGTILHGRIVMNNEIPWGEQGIVEAIKHEAGHCHGFGHPEIYAATIHGVLTSVQAVYGLPKPQEEPTMGWYPNAVIYNCNKHSYAGRTFEPVGAVIHSFDGVAPNHHPLLDDPNRRGSWHYSILFDGKVEQHIDSGLASWHSGDMEGNLAYWGIELEGRHSATLDPVTGAQITSLTDLLKWLWATHGLDIPFTVGGSLREHRSFGTSACPNERFTGDLMWNRLMAELGDDDMSAEDKALLATLADIVARNGVDDDNGNRITGDDALAYVKAQGFSLALGQQELYRDKHGPHQVESPDLAPLKNAVAKLGKAQRDAGVILKGE